MTFSQPVPELPVPSVEAAQIHYHDKLGFQIAWHDAEAGIGAVSHGETAIFFRRSDTPPTPVVFWVFAEDVDAMYEELFTRGADIVAAPDNKPWGLRQFTVRDHVGNLFHIHHDL